MSGPHSDRAEDIMDATSSNQSENLVVYAVFDGNGSVSIANVQRLVDGILQSLDDCLKILGTGNKGWRQQNMVSMLTIDGSTHGIDHQSSPQG